MDNKLSELKAAAMAATPGPWILDDDSWSDGDNANVSTEERYDGRIVSIAQIEGGGSESGFDEPFSAEQQANARYITTANPAVVLALLAELEAKGQALNNITELWKDANATAFERIRELKEELEAKDKRIAELDGILEVSQGDLSDTEDAMHLWAERAKTAEAKLSRMPKACDGKEQDAFIKFALNNKFSTECHPLHFLFLDGKTSAARRAWGAAIAYCRDTVEGGE